MKATEIQELTNKFISLCNETEFKGCSDPFQSFWQGFDVAVELALKAMQDMVKDHAEDIECNFESKEKRYISCGGYELQQKRQANEIMKYVGGS